MTLNKCYLFYELNASGINYLAIRSPTRPVLVNQLKTCLVYTHCGMLRLKLTYFLTFMLAICLHSHRYFYVIYSITVSLLFHSVKTIRIRVNIDIFLNILVIIASIEKHLCSLKACDDKSGSITDDSRQLVLSLNLFIIVHYYLLISFYISLYYPFLFILFPYVTYVYYVLYILSP